MAEYIEREALPGANMNDNDYADGWNECLEAIAAIPAVDVREVVTCGECVYFRLNSCMRWADGTFMERTDFCSRAAKREKS